MFGAPPVEIDLPFLSTSFVWLSPTSPAAYETSGSARTFVSNDWGKVGTSTPFPWRFWNAVLPEMTTSAFL